MPTPFDTILLDAAYAGVEFPVGNVSVEHGHTIVQHRAWGRPGADCEPTGREPVSGSLTALFINGLAGWGNLFPERYQDFIRTVDKHPIGQLTHPTHGILTVAIDKVRVTATADERNGVHVEVKWVEHNASVSQLLTLGTAPPATPELLEAQIIVADDLATRSSISGLSQLLVTMRTHLQFLEGARRTYSEVYSTIRTMQAAVDANLAIVDAASALHNDVAIAYENCRATVLDLFGRYIPFIERRKELVVPRDMAVFEIAVLAYNDASLTDHIYQANPDVMTDPLFVRAGTVLTILPV